MTATTRPLLLLVAVAVAALAAGCGGSNGSVAATSTTDTRATSTQTSEAALKGAVRAALASNLKLSLYVLWHNEVPPWATGSTRGPALKALRTAAAARRRQGIQIKNLRGHSTIISIQLAPSYTSATAEVRDTRSVAPYKRGHRLGRAIVGTDHSRVQLRRVGTAERFIVWSVSPIR
jgi:hypothetical protein